MDRAIEDTEVGLPEMRRQPFSCDQELGMDEILRSCCHVGPSCHTSRQRTPLITSSFNLRRWVNRQSLATPRHRGPHQSLAPLGGALIRFELEIGDDPAGISYCIFTRHTHSPTSSGHAPCLGVLYQPRYGREPLLIR